ncbi:MAG: isocitrate/isopropylmalate family dehydrogenase [Cyanobacteria bacterium J06621_11]
MTPLKPPLSSDAAPRHYRIAALPGEGIGPEVVNACLTILQAIAQVEGFTITVQSALIGGPAQQQFGTPLPPETLAICEASDGILFGAVTKGGLLELRRHFDFFINLRPVKPSPSLLTASPIKAERLNNVDLLFVRELVSGIYFGASGRGENAQSKFGFHTMHYADSEIRRIARVALQFAQNRHQHLVVAHKENALPHLPWSKLVQEEAHAFPDINVEPMLIDNLAMQLVMRPADFDVVLAGNLFGDILSDLGGAIAGSIGLLGSASLNISGFGMYEAVHGTAPDIAGQGVANPLGTLAGVVLMLQQWKEFQAAQNLIDIQTEILTQGYRTADLQEDCITKQAIATRENALRPYLVTTAELTSLFVTKIQKLYN